LREGEATQEGGEKYVVRQISNSLKEDDPTTGNKKIRDKDLRLLSQHEKGSRLGAKTTALTKTEGGSM